MNRRILGTAGHIDHGKTSLVRALTGVDTDRLEEEKRRGITIELGFASFEPEPGWSFGIVDVPGHEGFIRTMVAGATGMDIVLLVVAADEGAMPQTREHLDIIGLLRVPSLVVALTKADAVDEEWMALVRDDVADLLSGTPYAGAPIVATSAETGTGLDALTRSITEQAERGEQRSAADLLRLPVDRAFTVEGTGTVVTGTLWSGQVSVGDIVRVLPGEETARVRGLEVHGESVSEAVAGQRTAVALTGPAVKRGEAGRGAVLVSDPHWASSMMLTVFLEVLPDSGWSVSHHQRVRVHLGTTEVMARAVLFGLDELGPGDSGLCQLRLEGPIVSRAGDRIVIRSYSPVTTIAGGLVLEPNPPKRKRLDKESREALRTLATPGADHLWGAAALRGWKGLAKGARLLALPELGEPSSDQVTWLGGYGFVNSLVEKARGAILRSVEAFHQNHPLEAGMPLSLVRKVLDADAPEGFADDVLKQLEADGEVDLSGNHVRLSGFEVTLEGSHLVLHQALSTLFLDAGLQPPLDQDVVGHLEELGVPESGPESVKAVLSWMTVREELVSLGGVYHMWKPALNEAVEKVRTALGGQEGLGPADFKEVVSVSRKHLMPILSYLDDHGVTRRDGGLRSVPLP